MASLVGVPVFVGVFDIVDLLAVVGGHAAVGVLLLLAGFPCLLNFSKNKHIKLSDFY